MRRAIAAVLAVFLATSVQAHAQLFPAPTSDTPAERTVVDALVMAIPPVESSPCIRLSAGVLTVRARNTADSGWPGATVTVRPAMFRIIGYRGEDSSLNAQLPVWTDETSISVPVSGAMYCWFIDIDAPVRSGDSMAARTNYSQFIALKITHRPD